MNAIEFVKECGIDVARRTLGNAVGFGCSEIELFRGKYIFRTDDLKQIVDAFWLVEKDFGSVEIAEYEHMVSGCYSDPYWIEVRKAINLVEQCNA